MEAAAEMIVHSACRHFAQRVQGHRQCFVAFGRFVAIAREDAEKEIQRRWSRKFWRITESAFTRIIDVRTSCSNAASRTSEAIGLTFL